MLILEAIIIRAIRALDGVRWRIRERQARRILREQNKRAGRPGTNGEWY